MSDVRVAIIGAGPYGLSLAAHLAALKIEHRIFGRPMQFWSQIAEAADKRYLKSYCFGTNLSAPRPGLTFSDYNTPRNLETFEPCSIANFAAYGRWFQESSVPWVEQTDVVNVRRHGEGFTVSLANGERFAADQVIVATGLASFAHVPRALSTVSPSLVTHTSEVASFASFQGRKVAVLGAGQSALEAAVLLHEAGAHPTLLVRERAISWHSQVHRKRSLWRRLRSPITGLGTGPKAWLLTRFPRALHRMPDHFRTRFVKTHLPAEGAWWLRERFEGNVPVHFSSEVIESRESCCGVTLVVRDTKVKDTRVKDTKVKDTRVKDAKVNDARDRSTREMTFDHVVAGSGYTVDVDRLNFLDPTVRSEIERIERSPKLNATFESSVPGLRFVGAISAMSFGPLFRFVVGADYAARTISRQIARLGQPVAARDAVSL